LCPENCMTPSTQSINLKVAVYNTAIGIRP
jgi:hypothetical protein